MPIPWYPNFLNHLPHTFYIYLCSYCVLLALPLLVLLVIGLWNFNTSLIVYHILFSSNISLLLVYCMIFHCQFSLLWYFSCRSRCLTGHCVFLLLQSLSSALKLLFPVWCYHLYPVISKNIHSFPNHLFNLYLSQVQNSSLYNSKNPTGFGFFCFYFLVWNYTTLKMVSVENFSVFNDLGDDN